MVAYLWRHPERSSHHRLPLLVALYVGTKSKVSHFDRPVHSQEDIIRLDVSVNHTLQKNSQMLTQAREREETSRERSGRYI